MSGYPTLKFFKKGVPYDYDDARTTEGKLSQYCTYYWSTKFLPTDFCFEVFIVKILGFNEIVVCFKLICSHLFEIPCMRPWVLWMRYRFDTVCQGKVRPRLETPSRGRCDLDQGQLQGLYQQWPELSRVLCPMVSIGFITYVWYSLSVCYNHNCLPFSELKFFLKMYIYVQVSLSYNLWNVYEYLLW